MSKPTCFFQKFPGEGVDPLEGRFAADTPNVLRPDEEDRPLRTFAGQFCFVELKGELKCQGRKNRSGLHVFSTEGIAIAMDSGRQPKAISGPFNTREAAEQSFERFWEMILDDD
jgi:hypothetical protein